MTFVRSQGGTPQLSSANRLRSQGVESLVSIPISRSRRGVHPLAMNIPGGRSEVSVHRLASYFPSLPSSKSMPSLQAGMQQGYPVKRTS